MALSVAEEESGCDFAIFDLLMGGYPAQFTKAELALRIERSEVDTEDGLNRLLSHGLIHRNDDFFFVSHSAHSLVVLLGEHE